MDITDTLAPKSDQLDAVDLLGGPMTFTITQVSKGNAEQPVNVHLAEFPRVWRPGKSMRRVLASCWGTDAAQWVGRRVTLYCDESVTFGNDVVGGTRISHLSHIDGRKKIPLLVKRGKSATFTVEPLPDAPAPDPNAAKHAPILASQGKPGTYKVDPLPTAPTPEPLTDSMIACATDLGQLGLWWKAHPDQRAAIEARVAEVKADEAGE